MRVWIDDFLHRDRLRRDQRLNGWTAAEIARQYGIADRHSISRVVDTNKKLGGRRYKWARSQTLDAIVEYVGPHIKRIDDRPMEQTWKRIRWDSVDEISEIYAQMSRAKWVIEFTRGMDMLIQGPEMSEWTFRQTQRTRSWSRSRIDRAIQLLLDTAEADARKRRKTPQMHWIIASHFLLLQALHEKPRWQFHVCEVLHDFHERVVLGLLPPLAWSHVDSAVSAAVRDLCGLSTWDNVRIVEGHCAVIRPDRKQILVTYQPDCVAALSGILLPLIAYVPYLRNPFILSSCRDANVDDDVTSRTATYIETIMKTPLTVQRGEVDALWHRLSLES